MSALLWVIRYRLEPAGKSGNVSYATIAANSRRVAK